MAKSRAQPRPKVGQKYADPHGTVKGAGPFTALIVTAVHSDGTIDLASASLEDDRTWSHIKPHKLARIG